MSEPVERAKAAAKRFAFARSHAKHRRSLAKAVTWRGTASIDTFLLGWLITGQAAWAGTIASIEILTKIVIYYVHERIWERVAWGRPKG